MFYWNPTKYLIVISVTCLRLKCGDKSGVILKSTPVHIYGGVPISARTYAKYLYVKSSR